MTMTLEQLRNQIAGVATEDDYLLQGWIAAIDAHLTQPAQSVDVEKLEVWIVQDETGQPIHCASWPEACHEHINDAINEHGIEEAKAWKVLRYENASSPSDEYLINEDTARLALFNAIRNIKIGNKTDDKLILRELHKLGYWITTAALQEKLS